MLSDPVADMLTRIRNGYLVNKAEVVMPYTKVKKAIAKILLKEGYLQDIKILKNRVEGREVTNLVCKLKYQNLKPVISKIISISKPSLRVYVDKKKLPRVLGGMGIGIISTSKGIMTNKEAKKQGLGGEVICKVW